ncbi:MAG: caspase family protein [Bacteroidales bacterium]|nr:caspase family protein [Bacteroidales bacterium]
MRKFIFFILLTGLVCKPIQSQEEISGQSDAKQFTFKTEYERGLPPNLFVNMQFDDKNGNGILEAEETAELKLSITNKGKGKAQGLKVKITDEKDDPEFQFEKEKEIKFLYPDQTIDINIPITAGFNLKSNEHKLKINVLEHFGYDMDPAYLVLNTLEYQKPELAFSGYEVIDVGEGTGAITEDGQIQPGEMVKLKVYIQNIGKNVAQNVTFIINSTDQNVYVENNKGIIGNIAVGEVKDFWITVSPNKRVGNMDNLPLFLTLTVDRNIGGIMDLQMPVAMNQKPPENNIVEVKADVEKLQKQVARFEYTSNKFTANVGKIKNIEQAPLSNCKRNNAVAVVIGIEKYTELPPAPYAANDAKIIADYFKNTLGIKQVVTFTNQEAKGFFFDDVFNPTYGELQKTIIKGQTDVFVFYSGHGIPSTNGEEIYLMPSDGKTERLSSQGYNMDKFYANLEDLGARNSIVFMDACFSGVSKQSEKIESENLLGMKAVKIKPKMREPWLTNPNFAVFNSSSSDEISLAFDQSETGLFTYYMCLGLRGEADTNKDKKITTGELEKYIQDNVVETSKKIAGQQTPQFNGNKDYVLVEY